jgi:hypothetical protein
MTSMEQGRARVKNSAGEIRTNHPNTDANPFIYDAPLPVTPAFLDGLKDWTSVADRTGREWRKSSGAWVLMSEARAARARGSYSYPDYSGEEVARRLLAPVTVTEPHYTALCNACGTRRLTSLAGARRGSGMDCTTPERIASVLAGNLSKDSRRFWERVRPFENAMCELKCQTCGVVTRHALVCVGRDDPAEQANAELTAGLQKVAGVSQLVDDFQALGVRVFWAPSAVAATLRQYLDDNQWTLTLNPEREPGDVLEAMCHLWDALLHERERQWFVTPADPQDPLDSPSRSIGVGRR